MLRVAFLLFLLPLCVLAGTCLNGQTWLIPGANLVVEVVGGSATIYPPLPDGKPDRNSFALKVELTMIVERERFVPPNTPNPSTNDICYTPLASFPADVTMPLGDFYKGKPCGRIVKYANLTDYDCAGEVITSEPAPGVKVHAVKVTMSHPSQPLVFVSLFELPNANLTKQSWSNTTYTNGTLYSTHYRYVDLPFKA